MASSSTLRFPGSRRLSVAMARARDVARRTFQASAAAALLFAASAQSTGAQIDFTDRAAFQGALGAFQTYYAADVPPSPPVSQAIGGVGIFTVAAPTDFWVIPSAGRPEHSYATPDGLSTRAAVFGVEPDAPINDFPISTLESAIPLFAFGIDYGLPRLSPPFVTGDLSFTFEFNNGLTYTRMANSTGEIADPLKRFEFFGLISPTPFTRITLQADDTECVGFCARNNASWDAITIAAVPEPATFALVAGGLAMLPLTARRRRGRRQGPRLPGL